MENDLQDPFDNSKPFITADEFAMQELKTSSGLNVYQRAHLIMNKIGAISKGQRNKGQNYDYRGIEDVLKHLQPLLSEHGLMILPVTTNAHTEPRQGGSGYFTIVDVNFTFVNIDDPKDFFVVPVRGEGFDSLDKSTGKAYSSAYKIMCFQTFCVPTEEANDTEKDDPKSNNRTQLETGIKNLQTGQAQPNQALPPAPAQQSDARALSPQGWEKIFSQLDKLEVAVEKRSPFILQTLKKLDIPAPPSMNTCSVAIGKSLVAEFEKQVAAKDDFFNEPSID